jgi:hypothetical protein
MNLLPDENIIYRTGLHWVVLIAPVLILLPVFAFCVLWGLFFLIGGLEGLMTREPDAGVYAVVGMIYLIPAVAPTLLGIRQMRSAKFIVTNQRVILNSGRGILKHREVEMPLEDIQNIVVQPSRFAYPASSFGTIIVVGKMASTGPFRCVSRPQVFREKVEEQITRALQT